MSTTTATSSTARRARSRTPFLVFTPTGETIHNTYRLSSIARDIGMDLYPNSSLSHIIFSWPSASAASSVPLPFPTLSLASLSLLRYFVSLSNGLFALTFLDGDFRDADTWECSSLSLSLVSQGNGLRVDSMDAFSRVLAGCGWTLFRTGSASVFLFRKVDANRVRTGEGRLRELRLPALDFNNLPSRILHYLLLMTDDVFFLAS